MCLPVLHRVKVNHLRAYGLFLELTQSESHYYFASEKPCAWWLVPHCCNYSYTYELCGCSG